MERQEIDSYKEAADTYEAYKDYVINLADLEKDIVNTVCQIAEIRATGNGYDDLLDMIDDERVLLHDRLCDLYSKKYKELPPDEQARIAYNQAVSRKKEADEKERMKKSGGAADDMSSQKEAKEPADSPDAKAVWDLKEMVKDAAKTLEIALFGNLDEMTDKEKAAALKDIYASLMAELYGGGIDPEKVEAAEKEMDHLKAAAELPFV